MGNRLSKTERRVLARELVNQLPHGFEPVLHDTHGYAARKEDLVVWKWRDGTFIAGIREKEGKTVDDPWARGNTPQEALRKLREKLEEKIEFFTEAKIQVNSL